MHELHRQILNRLLAAWVAISLIVGGTVAYLGMSKIDDQLVALAADESSRLSGISLPLSKPSPDNTVNRIAADFVRQHFVVVEIYNRNHDLIAEARSSRFAALENELVAVEKLPFPAAEGRNFTKRTLAGQSVLQVMLPLKDQAGNVSGYFEGFFIIDPATLARLRQDMVITLGIVLCAVLLTTIAFYPVILALNRDVIRYSHDLLKGNIDLMETLGSAVAQRDSNTSLHNYRVTIYSVRLAEAAGLDKEAIRQLIAGAFLHDIGKIGISDTILLKPAKLSVDEFSAMKKHVNFGVELLKKSPWLQRARDVVECHHERIDGSGYPAGLAGDAIPMRARIFAIVDVFDALTSQRPYKEAFPFERAMSILLTESPGHFDLRLLAVFESIIEPLFKEITQSQPGQVEARLSGLIDHYYYFDDKLRAESPAAAG
jgi:putative nucleotidyltransferase with HDIG domain